MFSCFALADQLFKKPITDFQAQVTAVVTATLAAITALVFAGLSLLSAVWIDLVSLLLWLISFFFSLAMVFVNRRGGGGRSSHRATMI